MFAERKDVFSPLLKEMGDRRRMSGEIKEEEERGGRVTGRAEHNRPASNCQLQIVSASSMDSRT